MKYLIVSIIILTILIPGSGIVNADSRSAPVEIRYVGMLEDSSGTPLYDTFNMVFSLYNQVSGGNFEWQENHTGGNAVQTNQEGAFSVVLNSTGTASGNLATLITDSTELWLELQINGEILSPRLRFTSAALSMSSPWSGLTGIPGDFADGLDYIGISGTGIDLTAEQFDVSPLYRLPQSCTNGQVAKYNSASGVWMAADDLGGSYSADHGLMLSGTEFQIIFAGNGTLLTASRSDHDHVSQTWSTSLNTALSIETKSVVAEAAGIHGIAGGNSDVTAVKGEINTGTAGTSAIHGLNIADTGTGSGVLGRTNSTTNTATGVYGYAGASTGENVGVLGISDSPTGFGIYSDGNMDVTDSLASTGNISGSGNLTAGGNLTWSKTSYISIHAAAFHRSDLEFNYEVTGTSYRRTSGESISDRFHHFAKVQLPHGATVITMTAYGYSRTVLDAGTFNTMVQLWRSSFTGSQVICFQNISIDSVGSYEYFTMMPLNPPPPLVIDNTSNMYYLDFWSQREFDVTGVVIEYTLTQPY